MEPNYGGLHTSPEDEHVDGVVWTGYRTRAEPQLTSKAITIPDNDTPNCYSLRYTALQSSASSSIQSIIVLVVTRVIIAMPVNWTISQPKFIN